MSLGRRKIRLQDATDWIFNRVADVYAARPDYPCGLLDALAELAPIAGRIADLGAGIGHISLPLAARGFQVAAVEPAAAMLERLRSAAHQRGLRLHALHATAEALPLEAASIDLVIVADAAHFLDRELAGAEIARVLTPRGALALVTCEFAQTSFMQELAALIEGATPRRPRATAGCIAQLSALTQVRLEEHRFEDATLVEPERLEQILRSISFIGPAMNAERFATFKRHVHALPHAPVWARSFTLHAGRRA